MSNNVFRCSFTVALFATQHAIKRQFNSSNVQRLIAHNIFIIKMVAVVLDIKPTITQRLIVSQHAAMKKISTDLFLAYKM